MGTVLRLVAALVLVLVTGVTPAAPAEPPLSGTPERQRVVLQALPEPSTATDTTGGAGTGTRGAVTDVAPGVNVVGVTWPGPARGEVSMRTQRAGVWSPWRVLEVETGPETSGSTGDVVIDVEAVEVRSAVPGAALDVWHVPPRPEDHPDAVPRVDGLAADSTAAVEPQAVLAATTLGGPVIGTRQDWGADESVRAFSPNHVPSTQGVTIHHTAGSNDYTAAQVPAILRGIYHYHAVTLGWGDVGYNLLVDKYGRAWEGRRGGPHTSLRGAHALGMNYDTAGISLLGNHEVAAVPQAGFEAMAAVTAWKLDAHGLDVADTFTFTNTTEGWTRTLGRVHMHQEVNATLCPGQFFVSRFGEFRTRVAAYQALDPTAVQSIAGATRYETAAELAEAAHPFGAETVYLAQGAALADVLALGPSAGRDDSAVLLTGSTSVPPATLAALSRLAPTRVVVVGGTAVVSETVVAQLVAAGHPVTRVAGADRYETASLLSRAWDGAGTVYLASGVEPADALSGGAAAAHRDVPLLLTNGTRLAPAVRDELARLAPARVVLLGGTTRIAPGVEAELADLLPQVRLDRLAGADRYATSALVAREAWPAARSALLANGSASIDAVAGTQLADYQDAPLLLTRQTCQPAVVHDTGTALGTTLHTLLGGTSVLALSAGTQRC
jgi:putative cell wall-binding protein